MAVRKGAALAALAAMVVGGSGCGDSEEPESDSGSAAKQERAPLSATTLTVHERAFTGKIEPRSPVCVQGREVTFVYRAGGVDNEAGSDTTDRDGRFELRLPDGPQPGVDYLARIAPTQLTRNERTTLCEGGETASVKRPSGSRR